MLMKMKVTLIRIGLVLLLATLASGCTTAVKQSSVWDLIGKNAPKAFQKGNGLLIIGVNPLVMNNKMSLGKKSIKKSAKLLSFSVKNIDTGFVKTIKHHFKKAAVVSIPSGRYCLSSLNTYINLKLKHCKAPYFDVESGSVENAGVTTVGINYNLQSNKIHHKIFDVNRSNEIFNKLGSNGTNKVAEFFANIDNTSFPKTFYVQPPKGGAAIIRLKQNGEAEVQKYAQNQPYYNNGTWETVNGGYKLSFYEGNITYRLKESGDFLVGLVTSKFKTKNPWSTFDEHALFFATRAIGFKEPVFSIANQHHLVIERGIPYPKSVYLSGTEGTVELSFNLELSLDSRANRLYKPTNISIKFTSIEDEYVQSMITEFSKYRYSIPKEIEGNIRFSEKIMLRIVSGEPAVVFENSTVRYFNDL